MSTTRTHADLCVRGRTGVLAAVVEVKNPPHMTADLATQYHRLAAAAGGSGAQFFLLVAEKAAYLWAEGQDTAADAPHCVIPMAPVIAGYWPSRREDQPLHRGVLDSIVRLWLSDLVAATGTAAPVPAEELLAECGFLEAVRGGTLVVEEGI